MTGESQPSSSNTTIPTVLQARSACAVTSIVEEVDVSNEVAAVMPTAVLEEQLSEEDSVSTTPLTVLHICWKCQLAGLKVDFPTVVKSLIDNGSHLVLICELLVNALGLKRHHLNNPIPVSVVIPTSNKPKEMSLHEYVLLQLVSLDGSWTSKSLCAVITDSLCVLLLLGLLFLAVNRLITNYEKHSCIDKKNGYDLLYTNNTENESSCPFDDSKIQHSNVKLAMAMVSIAPVKHSKERLHCTERPPAQFNPAPFNPVAAVCECIESLVCQQRLETLECELKKEYHAVFSLIPHCNKLLTSVYAHVKLKDDTKKVL